ncbi:MULTISPECIES: hypothetical protein [Pseudomonas]|nr:hypothetical protein [Pseudomonas fluorescens]
MLAFLRSKDRSLRQLLQKAGLGRP